MKKLNLQMKQAEKLNLKLLKNKNKNKIFQNKNKNKIFPEKKNERKTIIMIHTKKQRGKHK